ncbi:Cysteine desulfurase [hydrothermal vent metagenome]|uniref:cysteine desulfurase n=1 Tax=hydrothermal vent metagenome TaxID=652676 RepID=A0A3B0T5P3_9ZZZZ
MKKPVYLDYNATTPIDKEVAKEMIPYIETFYGNPSSSYQMGRKNKEAVENAREQVAGLINCKPDEIVFTSGGTESNNIAIKGIAFANKGKGKHIITTSVEHPAVMEVCKYLAGYGFEVTYLPVDKYGAVDTEGLANAIRKDTILISIMHANNEVGTIQPIGQISSIANPKGIFVHTDAAQSVGKIETNITKLGVALLTIAGHKLYAPKGIGALYIRHGIKIENLMHGAGQERGIRPGTENIIGIVGLGKACEIAQRDLGKHQRHLLNMRERLLEGLLFELNNRVTINSNLNNSLPNTLSVAFDKVEAHTLASLISNDILISTGSACHSGLTEVSPVLKAMNINITTAASTVRISIGKNTTKEEIDFAVKIITNAVNQLS